MPSRKTKPWYRSKTIWTGIAAIVGAMGGMATGELETAQGLHAILTGLIAIFLRRGIAKP